MAIVEFGQNERIARMNGREERMKMIQNGPWSGKDIDTYLSLQQIPLRLSVVGDLGFPIVVSLWFLWKDQALFCATSLNARLARALAKNPRCGFEVAADTPPYRGVRGQGTASLSKDHDLQLLRLLLQRYLGDDETSFSSWLLSSNREEVAIRIDPDRLMTWDYSSRMSDPANTDQ
jgi:nitroimidazol reductase NimA-like FMN-containing flavoprotein (pyridoxamine 5'-phosphate oxidase superfamily)